MKRISKIKFTNLENHELSDKSMESIKGGWYCACMCGTSPSGNPRDEFTYDYSSDFMNHVYYCP